MTVEHIFDQVGDASDSIPAVPLTWIDDIAVFLSAPSPQLILEKVQLATTSLHTICCGLGLGLDLNFDKGKTEFVVQFVGPGSQAASPSHCKHCLATG